MTTPTNTPLDAPYYSRGMQEESFTYEPRLGYPFYITAKRYWLPQFQASVDDPNALTIIVLHSTSFHKETWEPALTALFAHASSPECPVRIREAWALDCPNHGAAAALNRETLLRPEFSGNFTCVMYAQAVHHFLSAGPQYGAKVDFHKRNLVGIGHSLGGNAILLLQSLAPTFNFSSLIIVEPMLSPRGAEHLMQLRLRLVKKACTRRDVWPSEAEALDALKLRNRTARWDPRVLDLYVKHGLRPQNDLEIPETSRRGVTLACTRQQEVAMYEDEEGPTKPVRNLDIACASGKVHLILGATNDILGKNIHEALIEGRRYLTVQKIPRAGHLVPQEVPDEAGEALFYCLSQDAKGMKLARL